MSPLRVAIVGFGKIARDQHVPAIAATEGVELVAVADPVASLPGVPHAATLVELLRAGGEPRGRGRVLLWHQGFVYAGPVQGAVAASAAMAEWINNGLRRHEGTAPAATAVPRASSAAVEPGEES